MARDGRHRIVGQSHWFLHRLDLSMNLRPQLALVGLMLACRATPEAPPLPTQGSLTGDVYLLMKNGDVKKGAANIVAAIPASDSLLQLVVQACRDADSVRKALRRKAQAAHDAWNNGPDVEPLEAIRRLETGTGLLWNEKWAAKARADNFDPLDGPIRLLASMPASSTETGLEANYALDSLPAGSYLLWADTEIGSNHYLWMRFSEVIPGLTTKADLDNSAVFDPVSCVIPGRLQP